MSLKISLRPHEKLIIGGAVIVNGNSRSDLVVENNVPLLREKDVMSIKEADSPCRRIYFIVQLMYLDNKNPGEKIKTYCELAKDVMEAAPSAGGRIAEISDHVFRGRYYSALKLTRRLIDYEQEVLINVRTPAAGL